METKNKRINVGANFSKQAKSQQHQQLCKSIFKYAQATSVFLAICLVTIYLTLVNTFAQTQMIEFNQQQQQQQVTNNLLLTQSMNDIDSSSSVYKVNILPPIQARPNVRVNIRDFTSRLSEDIKIVNNKTNCLYDIEKFFQDKAEGYQALDPIKLRDSVLNKIQLLLAQHGNAVNAIVNEAEKLAIQHSYNKNLRFNYTDVHRVRNELDPNSNPQDTYQLGAQYNEQSGWSLPGGGSTSSGGQGVPQFTSINGGTPVPGPPEWQTPFKSIIMQVNKNFGDIPVNTSMSAVHLPLPIYAGLPDIMNGIAWTEGLDKVFKKNLNNYAHVHHQYYGDHLGFLRTFPAHKWRIPRIEPDLFDARTRPWYVAGASLPKNVVILIDTSGSMTGLRREIAKGVVFEILDTLTNNDYFSVMRFSETVTPIGFPKCNLKTPKLTPALEEQCENLLNGHIVNNVGGGATNAAINLLRSTSTATTTASQQLEQQLRMDRLECERFRRQWDQRDQYLRDHPNIQLNKNGSYLTDDIYKKSIFNVTQDIQDAYLLPATSRNIRYLKSNFTIPTAGIANFTHALMAAFELLQSFNRTLDQGAQCNQAIMLITDGAIKSHDEIFNRYNYPSSPVRVFTYMIGREVGDITHTKAMACNNRGYYTHVINLSEVREQVQKYLPVMARPLVLSHYHPIIWTNAYGDETHQVLTDWVLETKRRERARIMLNEERERLNEANSTDVINIELTNIQEYDELPLVDEELKNRIICEDNNQDDLLGMEQSLQDELDPLGYNDLSCHWSLRKADLLTSVVKPVFDNRNTTLYFQRMLHKNIWTEKETHVRNAQLLGVAAVDLRINDIINLIPSYLLGPNGYAILIGSNGFVMHHPDLRALLEDPFDKQSKILKPYFNAVDLTHIEQIHHKNDSSITSILSSSTSSSSPNDLLSITKFKLEDIKLFKLREAALKRQSGSESFYIKRSIDCRKRLNIRQQAFYYGPIKDTPFSFMLTFPHNYGLNRLNARLDLNQFSPSYFKPSAYDLWTLHPEYKYCELFGGIGAQQPSNLSSVSIILELMEQVVKSGTTTIDYEDLTTFISSSGQSMISGDREAASFLYKQQQQHPQSTTTTTSNKIVCDKELFPSLLFDAAATYEPPDSICGANCDRPSSSFSTLYTNPAFSSSSRNEESCARTPEEMRSKMANIYGLEMSFLATRSGLTRVKVFDLTPRIKKLADLFIKRHNKAVDETWYSRTVDWNMRFNEEATIITVPYNAYVRLIAKLRQRITQRHPAVNDTRSNCDPTLGAENDIIEEANGSESGSGSTDGQTEAGSGTGAVAVAVAGTEGALETLGASTSNVESSSSMLDKMQNDEPIIENSSTSASSSTKESTNSTTIDDTMQQQQQPDYTKINYNDYSAYDFLDLLTNSSVHISATQSIIANKGVKQRSPVAVSGLLYDYATFARRFLNSTSLNIMKNDNENYASPSSSSSSNLNSNQIQKVEICPNGECPNRCGFRNDTIDCLLIDNNGFIVVGEELPYIGKSLIDYDEKLMLSLVERRVFYQVKIIDYQAICTRSNTEQVVNDAQRNQALTGSSNPTQPTSQSQSLSQISSSSTRNVDNKNIINVLKAQTYFSIGKVFLNNLLSCGNWLLSTLYSMLFIHFTYKDITTDGNLFLFNGENLNEMGQQQLYSSSKQLFQQAESQSAIANQSLLALLPNKTYLRPCEKITTYYETRPIDPNKLYNEKPEYFITKCGCLSWYVYDSVPKTNLIMLIVNTTNSCRTKCSPQVVVNSEILTPTPGSNFVPVIIPSSSPADQTGVSSILTTKESQVLQQTSQSPFNSGNKTTEDQVCAMLERDAQLYIRRPQHQHGFSNSIQQQETCLSFHPDESQIHICGSANKSTTVNHLLILISLITVAFYYVNCHNCCFSFRFRLGSRERK